MKIRALTLSVLLALSVLGARDAGANAAANSDTPIATVQALSAQPLPLSAELLNLINTCRCFSSVTAWRVNPVATPAAVFSSPDILFAILDLDVQLPWVAVGEVASKPLLDRILRSGLTALNRVLLLGSRSAGIRVGLYSWLHPTAPDFCSGETLHLLYFPADGTLVAFRYDSSRDC